MKRKAKHPSSEGASAVTVRPFLKTCAVPIIVRQYIETFIDRKNIAPEPRGVANSRAKRATLETR